MTKWVENNGYLEWDGELIIAEVAPPLSRGFGFEVTLLARLASGGISVVGHHQAQMTLDEAKEFALDEAFSWLKKTENGLRQDLKALKREQE